MAASLFTNDMAKALKQITEELIGEEDPAYGAYQQGRWMELFAGLPKAKRCECGSGSNAIGPGHSDWCGCYRRG